ncbi:cytochrome c biogenesis CcdA family protein [Gammaproteobacteria bacterium AB-CW1]|uniref:Cytochrome c biogenesis CcdA family protein n=1 Tax=Natronospira elongata TaxID=3110268 RepID=A0AAP6JI57_9GAMM|nr:cytochrome c biogenesis CcdA family protein [Gammaproteobacteria bacterium AB-CW1]
MEIGLLTLVLAAAAGALTLLNPCVLPLLPMLAGAATSRNRLGLIGLGGGMVVAFTAVGVLLAGGGELAGLSEQQWRTTAGVLMVLFGIVLVSAHLQSGFAAITQRLSSASHERASRIRSDHPAAQSAVGLLLGIAWTPCIGPTIGAAIGLAATGESLGAVTVVMLVFSIFAVLPLIGIGLASQAMFMRNRDRMARIGEIGRKVMGASLLAIGLLVLTGYDKVLETWLLNISPDWLVRLTTSV